MRYSNWLISSAVRSADLVLGGHPHLRGLLDDLLALGVQAGVESFDGGRSGRAFALALAEFGEQRVEGLHGDVEPTGGAPPARFWPGWRI